MESNEDIPEDIGNVEEEMKKNKIVINEKTLELIDIEYEIIQKTRILMWQSKYNEAEEIIKQYSTKNIWIQQLLSEVNSFF